MRTDKFALLVAGLACLILLGVAGGIYEVRMDLQQTKEELRLTKSELQVTDNILAGSLMEITELQDELKRANHRIHILEESLDPEASRWARTKLVRDAVRKTAEENKYIYPFKRTEDLTKYAGAVVRWADEYDVPVALVVAVTRKESAFRLGLESHAGALGPMQVMPTTGSDIAAELGIRHYNLHKIEDSVRFGTFYLSKMLDEFGRDVELAVRAYNCGPRYVHGILSGQFQRYPSETDDYAKWIVGDEENEGFIKYYEKMGLGGND